MAILCLYLRGDKQGKIDFGQMLEWFRHAQIHYDGVIAELKRLNGQGSMAGAVDTGITTIIIGVLFKGAARTRVKCGKDLSICRCRTALHGMSAFVHAMDRDGQHDDEDDPGDEFEVEFTHI